MVRRVRVRADGELEGDVEAVVSALARSERTVALSGAGISVESGIPDFRSPGGIWSVFSPEEYATLTCFLASPEKAWRFYRALGAALLGRKPNAAHAALVRLEAAGALAGIVTQNIDGLHRAAGSRTVLAMHGDGSRLHCVRCGRVEPMTVAHLAPGPVPACPTCAEPMKPDVVLFEEAVRELTAVEALVRDARLLLVLGTSGVVAPAGLLPAEVLSRGGSVLEFNLAPTLVTASGLGPEGVFVEGALGVTLPLVVERLLARLRPGGRG